MLTMASVKLGKGGGGGNIKRVSWSRFYFNNDGFRKFSDENVAGRVPNKD